MHVTLNMPSIDLVSNQPVTITGLYPIRNSAVQKRKVLRPHFN